jgi:ribonuclease P protein component
MKKLNTVKKNEEFTKVIKKGIYYRTPYFTIYNYPNQFNCYRFGISVGKKNGNAVTRNKIKRQFRNIIDKYKNNYSNNEDYIIIVKKDYSVNLFNEIEKLFYESIIEINKKRRNYEKKQQN